METVEQPKQWYVLHTYSGYENKVRENLLLRAQSMGMEDNIFEVIVPEKEETSTKDGVEKTKKIKIFPGYVLVQMIMSDEAWFVVRNTPGVTGFVGSYGGGSKPNPLLDYEVDELFGQMGITETKPKQTFEVGDHVSMTQGAFEGMEGVITEADDDHQKARVTIELFGRETDAEIDYAQLVKAVD